MPCNQINHKDCNFSSHSTLIDYAVTLLFSLGFVLGKKGRDQGTNDTNSHCWETTATFQDITVWNHDAIPSKDDAFLRAFHWFTAANAVSLS